MARANHQSDAGYQPRGQKHQHAGLDQYQAKSYQTQSRVNSMGQPARVDIDFRGKIQQRRLWTATLRNGKADQTILRI